MSILDNGKYRLKKDWNSCSIPSLVDIHEHDEELGNSFNTAESSFKPQARRSSLAVGIFGGKGYHDKPAKRRSSIGVSFLGRRESHKLNKENSLYENAVRFEKSDGSLDNSEIDFTESEGNFHASSPKESDEYSKTDKFVYFEDETIATDGSSINNKSESGYISTNNDRSESKYNGRRRRSSVQTKLERLYRKNLENNNSSILSSSPTHLSPDYSNQRSESISDISLESDKSNIYNYQNRQKRHSWWNIFVPDKDKARSKSRSVDHGLAAPFDIDSLRSKVEGRFESVDRLTNERKKSSLQQIPTTTYTVGGRDTLTSVAARFDTTPSELTHLNKLNSSYIFAGQQLLVPDRSAKDDASNASTAGDDSLSGKSSPIERKLSTEEQSTEEKDILEGLRPGSPRPGHIERVSNDSKDGSGLDQSEDPVITQRFLKISVRHITDGQGVVSGVLLVTPNAVMFDPNVSDTLVIEHGPESYGVIAPMELVVNAVIFHDIANMRVAGGSGDDASSTEKVEIYYPEVVQPQTNASQLLVKDETFPELGVVGSIETCDDQESICSSTGRDGDAFPKAFDRERVTPTEDTETKDSLNTEDKTNENDEPKNFLVDKRPTLEERRKSLLDHHWAIPSKDRLSFSRRSSEDEDAVDNVSNTTVDSGAKAQEPNSSTSSTSGVTPQSGLSGIAPHLLAEADINQLLKNACHDSGIDIRDPIPIVPPMPTKKVFSDADIVLSSDWVPPRTISPTNISDSPVLSSSGLLQTHSLDTSSSSGPPSAGHRKKTSSVSFSVDDEQQQNQTNNQNSGSDKANEKKNKKIKRLSYPLAWVEGLTGDGLDSVMGQSKRDSESAPNTGDSNQSVFSKVFSRRSSIGTFIRPHSSEGTQSMTKLNKEKQQPKLDCRSMVSIDDMPELFVSFDKLIPRPARACQDPPLYLRLRMGKPIGKEIPLPTGVMSYGKNKLRPEYWFSIPRNRVDELYRLIQTWVPHLYGELDEEEIKKKGYELIQHDTEWTKEGRIRDGRTDSTEGEDLAKLTTESWEVLSMSDDYKKRTPFPTGSFDLEFPIPDLIGQTEILEEEHREKLLNELPARAAGYSWSLVFSTSQHGFSLNSLYRKMQRLESPILIVIQDTDNNVFGALTSCSLHVSDHFYGTGESLLYKFNPSFKVYHWTGENMYFIKGNVESLSIGAGNGRFGLWLDGDLNQGRTQPCSTYGNEQLSSQEDFVIKTLECWAFV